MTPDLAAGGRRESRPLSDRSGGDLPLLRSPAPSRPRIGPRRLGGEGGGDYEITKGTFAAQTGMNAFMVRDLLGHKTMAMTGRYVEKATEPLRAAADAVSGRVAAAMSGQQEAEVIALKKSPG